MPQTYFVLKKALSHHLPIVVVINKIDKPAARPRRAVDQVFDLFCELNANEEQLDFPVVFTSAKQGYAKRTLEDPAVGMQPLFEMIAERVAPPVVDPNGVACDAAYAMAALESRTLYDPDKDQTAMRVYTLDGTLIAAAWGQDPAVAGAGMRPKVLYSILLPRRHHRGCIWTCKSSYRRSHERAMPLIPAFRRGSPPFRSQPTRPARP